MSTDSTATATPGSNWHLILGLAPAMVFWSVLVGWLAFVLYERAHWSADADRANLKEWFDEARVFRKPLRDLTLEYLEWQTPGHGDPADKADEIAAQLEAMADPTRAYQAQLPLFPEIYSIEVHFAPELALAPIVWESPAPKPRQQLQNRAHHLDHWLLGGSDRRAWLHVEYRLHAYSRIQRDEEERARVAWMVGGLVLTASIAALIWVYLYLRRERAREIHRLSALQEKEHAEKLLLENELHREELDRQLLQRSLEAAQAQNRATDAERAALELKSQLYASIGIMAGSYAHNIKNLLVRPNDLLARCLEADGLAPNQTAMLHEVQDTLGTVTERLQQILRTVRRDPGRSEVTRLNLVALLRDSHHTWEEMAREKWKLVITLECPSEPLFVHGDASHLQQALENLVFNARDATFEMRNYLRDRARQDPAIDPTRRKQALIEAAGWKGVVALRAWREGDHAILEVRDNGIGMSPEVRDRCTQTHFSTKRDNALYEGYNAGMGLGLSFVAMVLDHHGATLTIESEPQQGAVFRIRLPLAPETGPAPVG